MTVNKLKKAFRFLRKLSNTLVEDRCFEAHLSYMRRPNKSIVTKAYLEDRVTYSHGVKRKEAGNIREVGLRRWDNILSRQNRRRVGAHTEKSPWNNGLEEE